MSSASNFHDVELVEFHDALVARVEVTRGGNVCIEFAHLAVYRRESVDTLAVWSFHAELRLVGVEAFYADGVVPRDEADSLEDASLLGSDGTPVDCVGLARGESVALGQMELTWALSRARLVFRGGTASLRLLQPLERVETWMGDMDATEPDEAGGRSV